MAQNEYITPKDAKPHFLGPPHYATVIRWMTLGIYDRSRFRSKGSDRIFLKSVVEGGLRYTTLAWIQEFKDACTYNKNAR